MTANRASTSTIQKIGISLSLTLLVLTSTQAEVEMTFIQDGEGYSVSKDRKEAHDEAIEQAKADAESICEGDIISSRLTYIDVYQRSDGLWVAKARWKVTCH